MAVLLELVFDASKRCVSHAGRPRSRTTGGNELRRSREDIESRSAAVGQVSMVTSKRQAVCQSAGRGRQGVSTDFFKNTLVLGRKCSIPVFLGIEPRTSATRRARVANSQRRRGKNVSQTQHPAGPLRGGPVRNRGPALDTAPEIATVGTLGSTRIFDPPPPTGKFARVSGF